VKIREQAAFDFVDAYKPQAADRSPVSNGDFPEDAANELAVLERYNKHLYRPNTYLHKWWARRCGTTFRFILKQFVPDSARRDFYAPGGLEGLVVLDPMMGGGTTLHEAIRLGANAIGADIDPIPVLQARATLTHIPIAQINVAFNRFFDILRNQLARFYTTHCPICDHPGSEIKFTLYGLRRRCACGEALFVDTFALRRETGGTIRICPTCHQVYIGDHTCPATITTTCPLLEKGTRRCPVCGEMFTDLTDLPFRQRYVPLVIVGECPRHGQFFKTVDEYDLALLAKAEGEFGVLDFGDYDNFAIMPGPKSKDLVRLNVRSYLDLFSARQLGCLETALRQFQAMENPTERLLLALLVSTSLEFNSMLCGYKGGDRRRPGAIRHTFSHHAYSFPYTAAENNPIFPARASGTLQRLFHTRVVLAHRWAAQPIERKIEDGQVSKAAITGEKDTGTEVLDPAELTSGIRQFFLQQGDSRHLPLEDNSVDYVVTDPPYYDSVQYSDLAAFFRVWLRLFLRQDVDWDYDTQNSAVAEIARFGPSKYGEILGGIFKECRRVLKPEHGRLVFTFHHWKPQAWAELTLALKHAGFHLVNCHVVISENPISVHIRTLRALKHDCILMLAPTPTETEWTEPAQVDNSDSYTFCRECGAILGWLLDSSSTDDEIRNIWTRLLEGR